MAILQRSSLFPRRSRTCSQRLFSAQNIQNRRTVPGLASAANGYDGLINVPPTVTLNAGNGYTNAEYFI
jgi:hypothetical protein